MPLETGDFISNLDKTWPLGGDPINKGDDHFRLIKHILQTTFPGDLGNGFATAIISTETELNYLTGLTDNVQTQIDALDARIVALETSLNAPVGTQIPFYQATAPVGWTARIDLQDYMLRVVNVAGGGSGGTDSPILNDKIPTHTHVAVNAGDHVHAFEYLVSCLSTGTIDDYNGEENTGYISETLPAGDHTHVIEDNVGGANWVPKYIDMIIGVKD